MTPRQFCASGRCDVVKGAVHVGMLIGATLCAGYNLAAWGYRGERHNGINAVLYVGLVMLEVQHVRHHAS